MQKMIQSEPVIPIKWGTEQKGMQTGAALDPMLTAEVEAIWLRARDDCMQAAQQLSELGVHKSLCNRLTEPWMWITVVMSATKWKNFFRLRCHQDAEIHFQLIANMIREQLETSRPMPLSAGQWHLPYIEGDDWKEAAMIGKVYSDQEQKDLHKLDILKRASVARVARVSYMTHGSNKKDLLKDVGLFYRLYEGSDFGHFSPFGHVAEASDIPVKSGPFVGFKQFRKEFFGECADED
jgi:hypothetical protein